MRMKGRVYSGPHRGGEQRLYRFSNGYGASVIRNPTSYGGYCGLWELAPIKWHGESIEDFRVTGDITVSDVDKVAGYLTEREVDRLLKRIFDHL